MKRLILFVIGLILGQQLYSQSLGLGYDFVGNGKDTTSQKQTELYLDWPDQKLLTEAIQRLDSEGRRVLQTQKAYLSDKKSSTFGNMVVSAEQLQESIQRILENSHPENDLALYRIEGEDGKGNVHFTAYYTPVVDARREPDTIYRYPIYRAPTFTGKRPTREAITKGALAGQGLELAWTSSAWENYVMQVQGSGYLRFADGTRQHIQYDGQNGYAYTSIGQYMVQMGYIEPEHISMEAISNWFQAHPDRLNEVLNHNQSFVFFRYSDALPRGAANTELVAGYSIAVDPDYIPMGAVLLAKVPVLDAAGRLHGHRMQLLTAQDRGGAIRGPGHVDVYQGIGDEAAAKAGFLHHYGSLWLVIPR